MTEDQKPADQANIAIKQMNLAYHQQEDRLLLKLGLTDHSELQLWMTYRIAKVVWAYVREENKLSNEAVSKQADTPAQAVEQFEEEVKAAETLNELDFSTEYKETDYQTKTHTVKDGKSGEQKQFSGPMLAVKAVKQGKAPDVTILFTCANGLNVNLNLNEELSLAIFTMMQLALKEAAWPMDEPAEVSSASMVIKEESNQTVH